MLPEASSSKSSRKPDRRFPLWCDRGGLVNPSSPADEQQVVAFVEKCVQHGVTELVPWNGTRSLVDAARDKGIEVHPYLAFNSHGSMKQNYTWSVYYAYARSPAVKELLNQHRPIWSPGGITRKVSAFADQHPEFWAYDRERSVEMKPGQRLSMSLAFPEVRRYEADQYLEMLERNGGHGVQIEFVSTNRDDSGTCVYGYEEPMVKAFQRKHSQNPLELSNHDPRWVQFRADYVTTTLTELREKLRKKDPEAPMTVAFVARDRGEYLKVFQDWPAWVDQKLVDEIHLWFRTTSDVSEVERQVRQAAEIIKGRCPLVAELSCYHVGSFQDSKLLLEAARRARANGADAVGIYRSHAVEQLDFWPLIEQIAKM